MVIHLPGLSKSKVLLGELTEVPCYKLPWLHFHNSSDGGEEREGLWEVGSVSEHVKVGMSHLCGWCRYQTERNHWCVLLKQSKEALKKTALKPREPHV